MIALPAGLDHRGYDSEGKCQLVWAQGKEWGGLALSEITETNERGYLRKLLSERIQKVREVREERVYGAKELGSVLGVCVQGGRKAVESGCGGLPGEGA